MESISIFVANEDTTAPQLLRLSSPDADPDHDVSSSFSDDQKPTTRTIDEHISTLKSLEQGDPSLTW
jgi:hypothetical protein